MLLHTPVIFLISNLLRGLTAVLRVTLLPFAALVSQLTASQPAEGAPDSACRWSGAPRCC